jgi:hypothetical protein
MRAECSRLMIAAARCPLPACPRAGCRRTANSTARGLVRLAVAQVPALGVGQALVCLKSTSSNFEACLLLCSSISALVARSAGAEVVDDPLSSVVFASCIRHEVALDHLACAGAQYAHRRLVGVQHRRIQHEFAMRLARRRQADAARRVGYTSSPRSLAALLPMADVDLKYPTTVATDECPVSAIVSPIGTPWRAASVTKPDLNE